LFLAWFRRCVLGSVVLVLAAGLLPLKLWRTTPRDFKPRIRVSVLDLVQANALRRTALRSAASGSRERALFSWECALANNPADVSILRGFLDELTENPPHRLSIAAGVNQSRWLLRLSRTNLADVELAARVFTHCGVEELVVPLLDPVADRLTPRLEAAYLKALFRQGAVERFARRMERVRAGEAFEGDEELVLIRAAYLAGWGPPETAGAGRQRLALAQEIPTIRSLARRLQLAVSAHLSDPDGYRRILEGLESEHEARLRDHLGYWQLLVAHGRKAEAIRRLRGYPHRPSLAFEAVWLLQTYCSLGLRGEALPLAKEFTAEFNYYEPIWLARADMLIAEKRWEDVAELAVSIRIQRACADALLAFSFYLDGRTEFGRDRAAAATAAFEKARTLGFDNPRLAFDVGVTLGKLGYGRIARDLMLPLRPVFGNERGYWQALLGVAFDAKDPGLLSMAAQAAYRLAPEDATAAHNYAASLLVNRQQPAEALRHSREIAVLMPASATVQLNHALALVQNRRRVEAEAVLESISARRLTASERALYELARFEIHLQRGEFGAARNVQAGIDREMLFPNQRVWLRDALAVALAEAPRVAASVP
jgi:Flp pilus assembly protein TadD